jgi:hypothetical protein
MRLTRACLYYGLYTIDGSSMIINVLGYIEVELELTEPTPDFPNLSPLRSQTRTSSQDPTDKYHSMSARIIDIAERAKTTISMVLI